MHLRVWSGFTHGYRHCRDQERRRSNCARAASEDKRKAGRSGATDLSQSNLELEQYSALAPLILNLQDRQPNASGLREVAQQGKLLEASRLALQDLHQSLLIQAEENQFARRSLYAHAARHQGHHQPAAAAWNS
ncbi:unnamed protein product [Peronospora belbahrii]|uniref:Uncharacterized protein n=1 Tax=Peronospora belbahrii TaxID=622444 RepID=A0AAU9LFT0_9STRA|nr:unnamed protein product [Peronospora belbahrii]CAH0518074.1 unnamed protein product [Peronospora belbahrii]